MKFASRNSLSVSLSSGKGTRTLRHPPRSSAAAESLGRARRERWSPAAGKSFGRKRIEHAVEVAGACIMLAMFLMLALLA